MNSAELGKPVLVDRRLRLAALLAIMAAAVAGGGAFVVEGAGDEAKMLVASGALAVLGALLVAVSLVVHLVEGRELAALSALAAETERNLEAARDAARETQSEPDSALGQSPQEPIRG